MHPFHQRMIDELVELRVRIEELEDFIEHNDKFPTLNDRGQKLMRQQLVLMEMYAETLAKRVELL